jgi:hypothetical protein
MNLHFPGRENLDKPGIFVFPKVLVCLDCGSSQFAVSESELAVLALLECAGLKSTSTSKWSEEKGI